MTLTLVVTTPFDIYQRGSQITDPGMVDTIRAGENAGNVVMVSDQVILPPDPPPKPSIAELQQAYRDLLATYTAQQVGIDQATALNASQQVVLASQQAQLLNLSAAIVALQARIDNPNGGPTLPPNLADDLPLLEDDGGALVTDDGHRLVGDVRR